MVGGGGYCPPPPSFRKPLTEYLCVIVVCLGLNSYTISTYNRQELSVKYHTSAKSVYEIYFFEFGECRKFHIVSAEFSFYRYKYRGSLHFVISEFVIPAIS